MCNKSVELGIGIPDRKNLCRKKRQRRFYEILLAILVISYITFYFVWRSRKSPVISTKNGKVVGFTSKSRLGREYYQFLGIPYASPPVGELRFEPPIPPRSWKGIRSATSYGSECHQIELITKLRLGSEDCLYLNVHVPKYAKDDGKLLPVLFWIHGGAFLSGSADIYRPTYFMDEDVIMVGANYRVGALGFLNTGDKLIRGNQGMKDIGLALKWVQENIRNFSGDPNSVTVFGESAGGAAVEYLMLSPMAKGLFHRGISQSGSVLSSSLYNRHPKEQSQHLARSVNCPYNSSEEMIKCLKGMDARDIVRTHLEMTVPLRPLLGFQGPSIEAVQDETTFLSAAPIDLLKNGNVSRVPWLTGVNSQEGLPFAIEAMENSTVVNWANEDLDRFLNWILFLDDQPNKVPNASTTLWRHYFGNATKLNESSIDGLEKIYTSLYFFWNVHRSAKYHINLIPTYLYHFNYTTDFGFMRFLHSMRGSHGVPIVETVYEIAKYYVYKLFGWEIIRQGAVHGEELMLLFSLPFFLPGASVGSRDYDISRDLVKSWVQFAYDPATLHFQGHPWTPQNPNDTLLRYMQLEPNSTGFIDEPFAEQMELWERLKIR